MVSMRFADPKPESPFSLDENQVKKLSKREYTRLKKSHSSFKYVQLLEVLRNIILMDYIELSVMKN